jgi:hypothetical protein
MSSVRRILAQIQDLLEFDCWFKWFVFWFEHVDEVPRNCCEHWAMHQRLRLDSHRFFEWWRNLCSPWAIVCRPFAQGSAWNACDCFAVAWEASDGLKFKGVTDKNKSCDRRIAWEWNSDCWWDIMFVWSYDRMVVWSYDLTNLKIIWSYDHVILWGLDHMTIWSEDHMIISFSLIIWSDHLMITCSYDNMIQYSSNHRIGRNAHMIIESYYHMCTWFDKYWIMRSYAHTIVWWCDHMVMWS